MMLRMQDRSPITTLCGINLTRTILEADPSQKQAHSTVTSSVAFKILTNASTPLTLSYYSPALLIPLSRTCLSTKLHDVTCHKTLTIIIIATRTSVLKKKTLHTHTHTHTHIYFFLLQRCDPTRVMASSFLRFLDHTHNDAPQSVGLLWTSDQLVAETST